MKKNYSKIGGAGASVIEQKLKPDKKFLLFGILAITLVDFITLLLVSLGTGVLVFFLFLGLVVDLITVFLVLASNQRLRYGRIFPFIFGVLSAVIFAVFLPVMSDGLITKIASVFCVATHGIFLLFLPVAIFNASKRGKAVRAIAFIITVILLVATLSYSLFLFIKGAFGQGSFGYMNVVYAYDRETDTYSATGLVGCKGKAVIPSAFNGKKVDTVSYDIFTNDKVNNIIFDCEKDVKFIFGNGTKDINKEIDVFIDKADIDFIKDTILKDVKAQVNAGNEEKAEKALALFNRIVPKGLSDVERYISFDYDLNAIKYANYKVVKTWTGNVGSEFSLKTHAANVDYAKNYDMTSEAFLSECYDNGEKVLRPMADGVGDIDGMTVNKNIAHVKMSFERVYAVYVGNDNDDLYEIPDSLKHYGTRTSRFVSADDPFNLLSGMPEREGLTCAWEYYTASNSTRKRFTDIREILNGEDVTICARWSIILPTATSFNTNAQSNTFTYGDNITFTSSATLISNKLHAAFTVCKDGASSPVGNGAGVLMNNVKPSQSGTYKMNMVITVEGSSLVENVDNVKAVVININKKTLPIIWENVSSFEYDGISRTVTATPDEEAIINGDNVGISLSETVKNARQYNFSVSLSGEMAELYQIKSGDGAKSFTISKKPVSITWGGTSFTYDGNLKLPTAYAQGVSSDGALSVVVSGEKKNAGNYIAIATLTDSTQENNYNLTNPQASFKINPKSTTVTWSNEEFTYNGNNQYPTASLSGVVAGDTVNLIYTGYGKNAANYTVTVSTANGNYTLQNASKGYSIVKKSVAVSWSDYIDVVYDGNGHRPKASVSGVGGELVVITYSISPQIAVGDYTVAISTSDKNYELTNTTTNFKIKPKNVTVTWSNEEFTYNGNNQHPTASLSGVIAGDTVGLTYTGDGKDAGNYTVTVSTTNGNYTLQNTSKNYSISQKVITVSFATTNEFTYDGEAKSFEIISVNGLVGTDYVEFTYVYYKGGVAVVGVPKEVGEYEVRAYLTENVNYVLNAEYAAAEFKIIQVAEEIAE